MLDRGGQVVRGHGLTVRARIRHDGLAVGPQREALAAAAQHAEVVVVGMVLHHQHDDVLDLWQQVSADRLGRIRGLARFRGSGAACQVPHLVPLEPLPHGPAPPRPDAASSRPFAQTKPTYARGERARCELVRAGQPGFMLSRALGRPRRSLAPLAAVTAAALIFAVLLVLVRLRWAPLESADHGAAAGINGLIAGNAALVAVVKAVTWLGSDGVLWAVVGAAALVLALRRQWRLAAYLLVTGAGALVLDPVLKSLVGRLRPVVADPIAHGIGNSFPSGHALGSIVCYGAVLLVFLPAARGRWRTAFIAVIVALAALIGISRILLGVHYLSDVVGAWAVGIAWLGLTAFAFELTRQAAGLPVTDPVTEGLEPEARADLKPAKPGPAAGASRSRDRGRVVAVLVVACVLMLGVLVGLGELVTRHGNGNVLGDHTIPHWFAAHRTPGGDRWSLVFSTLGATQAILIVSFVSCVVFLAATRRWRPVVFIAAV